MAKYKKGWTTDTALHVVLAVVLLTVVAIMVAWPGLEGVLS